jgi:hypothetical protein
MSLEDILGIERYAKILDMYKVTGGQGPAGFPNKMVSREAVYRLTAKNTTYTGYSHTVAPGEFTPGNDMILMVVWYWPGSIASHTLQFNWRDSGGASNAVVGTVSGVNPSMVMVSYAADPNNNNIIIANAYNTFVSAGTSVFVKDIAEDWMANGGTITITQVTGNGVAFTNSWMRVYYFAMRT